MAETVIVHEAQAEVQKYILFVDYPPPTIEMIIGWDGVSPYEPPPGWQMELLTDPVTQVPGATYVDGAWVPPAPPEEPT